jgi:hypothetical protein
MKKVSLVPLVAVMLALMWSLAPAAPLTSVKVMPYSIDYPLIRAVGYPTPAGDSYERSFGIRRWLRPAAGERAAHDRTLEAAYKWYQMYGGYGVLGHGEEVFTRQAARWRQEHRGK